MARAAGQDGRGETQSRFKVFGDNLLFFCRADVRGLRRESLTRQAAALPSPRELPAACGL